MKIFFITVSLFFALLPADACSEELHDIVSLGNSKFRMGSYSSAEKLYSKALALKQDSVEVNFNYACALYKQERYDYALKYFHNAFEKADYNQRGKVFFNAGNTYFKLNQLKKASDMYKDALRSNPADEAARHNLSLCILKQKRVIREEERLTMEEAQTPETEEGSFLGAVSEQDDQRIGERPEQKMHDVASRAGGIPEVSKGFAAQYKNMTRGEMEKVLEKAAKADLDILKEYWRTKINHTGGPSSKWW